MKRRAILGVAVTTSAVAICGCSSTGSSDADPPEDAERKIAIEESSSVPEGAPVDPSIAVADPWVTSESTATLEATVENTGDETRHCPPPYYKGSSGTESEDGILLYNLQAADSPPTDYVPPCFPGAPEGGYVDHNGEHVYWTLEGYLGPKLAPGESATDTILLADDPTTNSCIPAGSYEFQSGFDDGDDGAFNWSFTVTVEDVTESQS